MSKPFLVIQHVESEDAACFAHILERSGMETELVRTYRSGKIPEEAVRYSGLLIMGGPMNVDQADIYPHLSQEMRLIRESAAAGVPALGICLGAQLMAASFGAPVYPGPVKEIGFYDVTLTREARQDRLFEGFPRTLKIFHWHAQTFDLPGGAVRLAGSPGYPNQAFRLGETLWGLQFHLEVTGSHIRRWLQENSAGIEACPDIDPDAVIADILKYEAAISRLAYKLFDRFLHLTLS
ncbi:MAG TPA: gamma-glutamyl-gamma-aminobutyrate hydrolase family protein [archaeon]|nr:gamma-glutamyl-gamma-aminobutyrate hydrolase family protein [archaeon]